MIRTVLGDIPKEELGVTLAHEHFIVNLDKVRHDGYSRIDTCEEVEPEIKKAMALGIQAAVEVTTIDMDRDVRKLQQISKDTGLKIVCATGFYLQPFHPSFLKDATVDEIANIYVRELTQGVDGTGIKPGIIAEIASSKDGFTEEERKCLMAAGRASVRTGSAVSTHTGHVTAQETVDILLNEGVDPDKVIIGHQDLVDDHEYHMNLLKRGVNIAFDTCGKSAYMPDETRAKNAKLIIEEGYEDHLVLSNDVSRRTYFSSYPNQWGYTAVMASVVPLMRKAGIKEETLKKFLMSNPARILNNEKWK